MSVCVGCLLAVGTAASLITSGQLVSSVAEWKRRRAMKALDQSIVRGDELPREGDAQAANVPMPTSPEVTTLTAS